MVETSGIHTATEFDDLKAKGRARAVLKHLSIPTHVPDYLSQLRALSERLDTDGPGTISRIRNQLVHPAGKNRAKIGALSGEQLFECGQLGLQYVELVALALSGYKGRYSRRGWREWKGDDEVLVPWAEAS